MDEYNNDGKEPVMRRVILASDIAEQNGLVSVVDYLKNRRLQDQNAQLSMLAMRHDEAASEIQRLRVSVDSLIASNRGGSKGVHGFIGERAQVHLSNAWASIRGEDMSSILIDDNGMVDYLKDGVAIQQKACRSNGLLGLDHILMHKDKYPEFQGAYQIPKDFYSEYCRLESLDHYEAGKLRHRDYRVWTVIQKVKELKIHVEPMDLSYDEIQRDTIDTTIQKNVEAIESERLSQTKTIVDSHKPTRGACLKTMAVSSALEGALCGAFKVVERKRQGQSVKSFSKNDIKDVACATLEGSLRGALRGTTVYLAENYTRIPGVVAGSAVTVAFESAKSAYNYRKGTISGRQCADNIGKSIVTTYSGAIGAKLCGKLCPIPVVGEVMGGFLFSFAANKACEIVANEIKCAILNTEAQPA